MTDIAAVRGIEKLGPEELQALVWGAEELGINPDWLATVISFESGFSPSIRNAAGSGATGLIQFMPSTARNLGTTTDELARMSFADQMGYVVKYLAPHRPYYDLESVYLQIFYPAAKNMAPGDTVASAGNPVYEQNKGFDREGKGYITRSDITQTIRSVLAASSGKPRIPVNSENLVSSTSGKLGVVLLILALGGLSYAAYKTRAKTLPAFGRDLSHRLQLPV